MERCVRVARARHRIERVVERDREARRLLHERAALGVERDKRLGRLDRARAALVGVVKRALKFLELRGETTARREW